MSIFVPKNKILRLKETATFLTIDDFPTSDKYFNHYWEVYEYDETKFLFKIEIKRLKNGVRLHLLQQLMPSEVNNPNIDPKDITNFKITLGKQYDLKMSPYAVFKGLTEFESFGFLLEFHVDYYGLQTKVFSGEMRLGYRSNEAYDNNMYDSIIFKSSAENCPTVLQIPKDVISIPTATFVDTCFTPNSFDKSNNLNFLV